MKRLLLFATLFAAGVTLLYFCSSPGISLNDGVAMYKLTKKNKRLIFVCGENNDAYYHIETGGTRFLWRLAWHTDPQERYELCFRHEQTAESIKQTLTDFKCSGIRVCKVKAWMPDEREFCVSSDGELVEP